MEKDIKKKGKMRKIYSDKTRVLRLIIVILRSSYVQGGCRRDKPSRKSSKKVGMCNSTNTRAGYENTKSFHFILLYSLSPY